jgi:hypothetical protein
MPKVWTLIQLSKISRPFEWCSVDPFWPGYAADTALHHSA